MDACWREVVEEELRGGGEQVDSTGCACAAVKSDESKAANKPPSHSVKAHFDRVVFSNEAPQLAGRLVSSCRSLGSLL